MVRKKVAYLRVVGMWQRRRREAASWPQYRREEEGVVGPPAVPLGESEQLRRYWIPSLAEGDSVKPPSLPGGRILPAL